MKILPRYRTDQWTRGEDFPNEPFVFDVRNWDIAHTMYRMLMTPKLQQDRNVVAVSLRGIPTANELRWCERAARKGNFRIIWLSTKMKETSDAELPNNT